jgi:hypothetical protein
MCYMSLQFHSFFHLIMLTLLDKECKLWNSTVIPVSVFCLMPSAMFISNNVNMWRSASTGVWHLINY